MKWCVQSFGKLELGCTLSSAFCGKDESSGERGREREVREDNLKLHLPSVGTEAAASLGG